MIELGWAEVSDLLSSLGFWLWLMFMVVLVSAFVWTTRG